MLFNLGEFIRRISNAIDSTIYFEYLNPYGILNSQYHQEEISGLALMIGETLGMDQQQLEDIYLITLMHDSGFVRTEFSAQMSKNSRVHEKIIEHCIAGDEIVKELPLHFYEPKTIYYHHENWDGSGFFGCSKNEIPMLSQIIRLCELFENDLAFKDLVLHKDQLLQKIQMFRGSILSPDLVDAFSETIKHTSESTLMQRRYNPVKILREYSNTELQSIAELLLHIIDEKSKYTSNHSYTTARLSREIAELLGWQKEHVQKVYIAGCLHDLGKLFVSKAILEKAGRLSQEQLDDIHLHPTLGRELIDDFIVFADVKTWIEQHHELLDGSGYPYGLHKDEISQEAQIITVCDIYSALTEKRPYRRDINEAEAFELIDNEFNGKLNKDYVQLLKEIIRG